MVAKVKDGALTVVEERKLDSLKRTIDEAKSGMVNGVLEIGKALAEAQEVLAAHHGGTFGDWVEGNCGFSKRTAYNYMDAFRVFGSCATVAQLEVSALYLLAKSEPAAKQAIKLTKQGQVITQAKAKELVKEAEPTPKKEKPPKNPPNPRAAAAPPATEKKPEPTPPAGETEGAFEAHEAQKPLAAALEHLRKCYLSAEEAKKISGVHVEYQLFEDAVDICKHNLERLQKLLRKPK